MLYWTSPEIGSRLVDVTLSLDKHTKERYSFDSVLANYGGFSPTLDSLDQIGRAIEELEPNIAQVGGLQGEYLRGTLRALKGFTRVMCGDQMNLIRLHNPICFCIRTIRTYSFQGRSLQTNYVRPLSGIANFLQVIIFVFK